MSAQPTIDPVTLTVIDNYLTIDVPRHGRDDDDDRLLADLQRVARLLVRDLRPAGADARPGRVLPVADRHDQVHGRRGRSTSSASTPSSRATSSSTTIPTAAPATSPSTCCSSRSSTTARSSRSSPTSRTCPRPGAKTPGGLSGDATEIFQEGLLLPPVKIKRRGEDVDDIWKIILANHRTPKVTYGDFRAMMGSLDLAERRIHELIDDYGLDIVARRPRRADARSPSGGCGPRSSAIPDGVYYVRGRDRGRRHHRPRLPDASCA